MNEPQPLPLWFIPLFPLFFVGMWMFVTALLSAAGGWGALGRLYPDPDGRARSPLQSFGSASAYLRRGGIPLPVNYNNCVVVEVAEAGLHLRPWLPFRFRHPPLLIPWDRIDRVDPGTLLFRRTVTIHPRGTGTRILLRGRPAEAVEEAWGRRAAPVAQPAHA